MYQRTNLSKLNVIPQVICGKVVIIEYNGESLTQKSYSVGKYCDMYDMPDNYQFNPELYDLLETEKYSVIANNTHSRSSKIRFIQSVNNYIGTNQNIVIRAYKEYIKKTTP